MIFAYLLYSKTYHMCIVGYTPGCPHLAELCRGAAMYPQSIFLCVHSSIQQMFIECLLLSGTVQGALKESCSYRLVRSGTSECVYPVGPVHYIDISKHPPPLPLSGIFFWWQDVMRIRKMRRIYVAFGFFHSLIYVFVSVKGNVSKSST